MATPTHVFRFGVFELDSRSRELRRHGLKVRLPEQSFQILNTLLSRPGQVVSREELRQVLWTAETFVDFEVGLNSAVRKLREALDDSADNPRFVETLPRRGYRFVASVTCVEAGLVPEAQAAVAAPATVPVSDPAVAPISAPLGARTSNPAAWQLSTPNVEPPAMGPDSHRRQVWRAAGVLLVVAMAAAGIVYQRGELTALRAGPAAEPIRSLVVLPFENLTGDGSQEDFVDSVTDAVTTDLAQIAGLDVISRTSARQFKDTSKRVPEIGSELKVDGVVEGAVARSGTGVRVTAKLIRAATDRNVWAQAYEGDVSHMLALQQRIASDVAQAAGRPQPLAGRTPRAIDPNAYDAYLKGLKARGLQRSEGFQRAVVYLEEAVAIQPDFAEAYGALAMVRVQFLFGGPFSPHETIPKAEAAARKALTLDPTLAQGHWALGQILSLYYWRWAEGAEALQRAATLRGGHDEFSNALSESLIRSGRFADAIAAVDRGRTLDPLSLNAQVGIGTAYRAAGQHDRALTELRRGLEMSPGHLRVRFQLGVTLVAMNRLREAITELEPAARSAHGHNSRVEAYLGYAYAAAGRTADARAVLKELDSHRTDQYVSWYGVALIHDALGEREPALAALQRAYEDRAVEFAQTQYPAFRAIASDPRFQAVMRNVGLPR